MKKIFFLLAFLIFSSFVKVNAANLPTVNTVEQRLVAEIQKIISAGHLRTTWVFGPDFRYRDNRVGPSSNYITVEQFDDLFHNPADTIYTLAIAYPYLSSSLQTQLRTYMQNEFNTYQPYRYDHMGTAGAPREINEVPSEVSSTFTSSYRMASSTPTTLSGFAGWSFHPFNYYALYKYSEIFDNASSILTLLTQYGHSAPGALPADDILSTRPHVLNSYIAGYYGYQGLREAAGLSRDSTIDTYLSSALAKRVSFLPANDSAVRSLSPYESGGFLYLVPELGDYLYTNALSTVQSNVTAHDEDAPYWMIPNVDEGFRLNDSRYNEGSWTHLYEESSLFLAKAYALKESRSTLEDYLHNSTLYRGDLFYIQNLVATIQSGESTSDVSLISIDPNTGERTNGSLAFTLTGLNFQSGATVKLSAGGIPDILGTGITVASSSSITGLFNLAGKTAGSYNVILTNPDSTSASMINEFTITNPAPTVTNISPTSGLNNDSTVDVTITGTNFLSGATVSLTATGQTSIAATNVVIGSATSITARFNLTGRNADVYNVVVTNSDGQTGLLSSAFTVINVETIAISSISDNRATYVDSNIPKYEKFELTFDVDNSVATNYFFPYDTTTPAGIAGGTGITVNVTFTSPSSTTYTQPAFYYQNFDYQIKSNQEWIYPTATSNWKARFSPTQTGTWSYRISAQDASGTAQSSTGTFTVVDSDNHGFVRVSDSDARYFSFEDGTYFPGLGYNMNYDNVEWDDPVLDNQTNFQTMSQNGIQLVRMWLSQWAIYGSRWNPWYSMHYHSDQAPRTGMDVYNGTPVMRLAAADSWYDNCMFLGFEKRSPAVKQNTNYRVQIDYRIGSAGITGTGTYGFAAKVGGWLDNCQESGTGTVISSYDTTSTDWETMTATWNSGANNWMPYFYLVVENATAGNVYVRGVTIQEDFGNGTYGPDIVSKPSMAHLDYVDQKYSYAFDKVLELAETNNIYLKPVLLDKSEDFFNKLQANGTYGAEDVNNFYGEYRTTTAGRWYQEAWWRYAQARWGYSPNIHSWELTNEADPSNSRHYAQADEFAIYMHQFTPNDHLVTTSFWTGFPRTAFWANASYPNLDYADIHEYDALDMDATHYYDTALSSYSVSNSYGALKAGGVDKPLMRGETGFPESTSQAVQSDDEITLDTNGVWLHNYVWAGINDGGMLESYWYDYSHIYGTGNDLRPKYKDFYDFINDIPLANGNYVDAAATSSAANVRTWGQKDVANNRAHIWVQNVNHTWCAVVGSISGCPQTWDSSSLDGTVTLTGFDPDTIYALDLWEFDTTTALTRNTSEVTSNGSGNIVLNLATLTAADTTDVGIKIAYSGLAAAPAITSINPNSGDTADSALSFTITGTGFVSGASVKLISAGLNDINATSESVVSSTSLTGVFNLSNAEAGTYSLVVTNSDFQSDTLESAFTVSVAPPDIASINPTSGNNSQSSVAFTVSGTHFLSGASIKLTSAGHADIQATSESVSGSTTITGVFNLVGADAAVYNVVVTNSDTQTDALANGFTVNAAVPDITSISPSAGDTTQTAFSFTVTGARFLSGATIKLTESGASDINATSVNVASTTSITGLFNLSGGTAAAYDVVVTNPNSQTDTLPNGFTVSIPGPATPNISSISPTSGNTSSTLLAFTLTGTNFVSGASVAFTLAGSTSIQASSETVTNGTSLSGYVNLSNATVGTYSVVITNPDTETYTLTNAFTVNLPAPTVTSISPTSSNNTTNAKAITVTGTNFRSGASVVLTKSGKPNIIGTSVTVTNANSLSAVFDIKSKATGTYALTVTNTDTQSGTLGNAFTIKKKSSGGGGRNSSRSKSHKKKSSSKSPSGPITLTKVNNVNIPVLQEGSAPWNTYYSSSSQPWFYGSGSTNGTKVEVFTWAGKSVCNTVVSGGVWGCVPGKPMEIKTHRIDIKYGSKYLPPFNLRIGGYVAPTYTYRPTAAAPAAAAPKPVVPSAPAPAPVRPDPNSVFSKYLTPAVKGSQDTRFLNQKGIKTALFIVGIGTGLGMLGFFIKRRMSNK